MTALSPSRLLVTTIDENQEDSINGATLKLKCDQQNQEYSQNPVFWGLSEDGRLVHKDVLRYWEGQQPFEEGDVMGLLLDCDAGTLTVKKNGVRLGVAFTGLTGELCWAVLMVHAGKVRIAASDPETF